MALAKKCDICGRLYEIYNTKGNNSNSIRLIQDGEKGSYYCIKHFDCCPECMSSINRHIEWITLNRNVQAIVEDNGYMRETNKE